jgi:hypothetical protein
VPSGNQAASTSDHVAAAPRKSPGERSESNGSISAQQAGESVGAAVKDAALGVAAHRIVPHRYEVRPIEPRNQEVGKPLKGSVAGIFDPEGVTKRGAVGDYQVRFDRNHNYNKVPLGPHINLGSGEHIAIKVPQAVVDGAGVAARALEGLDRVVLPVAIAVDGARLGNAFGQDRGKIGDHVVETTGSVLGGWAGALEGATAGTEIGAAIGMFGGPVGAASGAVAGGLVGGVAGAFAGSWLVEHLPNGPMHVRYAGEERQIGPGYQQSGKITSVRDGIVTQSTGRDTAEYTLRDLLGAARDPAATEKLLVPGNTVNISVGRDDQVEVTSLERSHALDRSHGAGR